MRDYLETYEQLLTGDFKDFGAKLSSIFQEWRQEENFSCTGFEPVIKKCLGQTSNENLQNATIAALRLADEKNSNGYHNPNHYREVTALTIALLVQHKNLNLQPDIGTDMAWLTIAAAAIHDYKHDGTGNKINGDVYPMRLEKLALSSAKPFLIGAGLSEDDWLKLSMMVLPTDTTPANGPSPSAQLKDIFLYNSGLQSKLEKIDPAFLSLVSDKELALCAQIISDADLGISAALDLDMAKLNSADLAVETEGTVPFTPNSLNGFLTYVCERFPTSPSGKFLLLPGFETIKAAARRDIEHGITYEIG